MSALTQAARGKALKEATAELVKSVGGQEAAASLLPIERSQVQRCCSPNAEGNFLNIRDVHELERVAPAPLVTAMLAKFAGGVFVPLPEVTGDGAADALALGVVELARELGDVSSRVSEALADGEVKPEEAAGIERELDELIARGAALRTRVQVMQRAPLQAVERDAG